MKKDIKNIWNGVTYMDKPKWIYKLGLNKSDIIIFYQNPNRFALSSMQKVDKNPTHSYYLMGYLKRQFRRNKEPTHKIKVCKIIKRDNSFLAFLGNLPFIFRDTLQVAVANINIYIEPVAVNPIFLTFFAVPFAIIYSVIFIRLLHV